MRIRRTTWLSGLGVMVLSAGVLMVVNPAGAIPLESWDDIIPNAAQRFKVLTEFGDAAVLDRETGLVWEKSPATTTPALTWGEARVACTSRTTGNRKGWRLPSMPELASLADPSVNPGPSLPPGHPFTNVQLAIYWSATTDAENPFNAWDLFVNGGFVGWNVKATQIGQAWCVRGGNNADAY